MKTYIVNTTVVDEICLTDRFGAANEYLTLDYIPGTAWWGAVAGLTGVIPGEPADERFRTIFYSGEVVFTNLYPRVRAVRAHPIPLSARTLKSAPGFAYGAVPLFEDFKAKLLPGGEVAWHDGEPAVQSFTPKCTNGVDDWLLGGSPTDFEPDWEPISGWYVNNPPESELVSVRMVMRGHNDREGPSGTTREGRLFSRQNIARGQEFQGALVARTEAGAEALEELIRKHLSNMQVEVSIGREPGCVRIELQDNEAEPPYWQPTPRINGDDFSSITVTLLSDAILVDRWLRPAPFLPSEDVAAWLRLDKAAVEGPVHHFSGLREVPGWNGAYSRAREIELTIMAGSAFLYEVNWPNEVLVDERQRRLNECQQRGIGLRRAEGFGEIRINDPFHYEYRRCGPNGSQNE